MISVVVPVYNVAQYLPVCLDSLIAQDFSDYEIILVDDGSTDESPAICQKYAQGRDKIRLIHKTNGGLSDARNTGIDVARGDWLTFADGDDAVASTYLSTLFALALRECADIAQVAYVRVDEQGARCDQRAFSDALEVFSGYGAVDRTLRSDGIRVTACAKLYRATLFSKIRFPVGKIHEDVFTTYRLVSAANRIAVLDTPLYRYVQRGNSIMHSGYNPARLDATEAYEQALQFCRTKYPTCDRSIQVEMYYGLLFYHLNELRMNNLLEADDPRVVQFLSRSRDGQYTKDVRKARNRWIVCLKIALVCISPQLLCDATRYRERLRACCKA